MRKSLKKILIIGLFLSSQYLSIGQDWNVGASNPDLIACTSGYATLISGPTGATPNVVPISLSSIIDLSGEPSGDYVFEWCCPNQVCEGCEPKCVEFYLTILPCSLVLNPICQ